jgi:phosphate transport system substrate-binding protein
MINKAGKTVQPTTEAFQAAASNADWAKAPGYYVILTDQPGEASWPITAATFILMHKEPTDKAASAEAVKFFTWAFAKGDKMAEELDYIPMPDPVVKLIEKTWSISRAELNKQRHSGAAPTGPRKARPDGDEPGI